MNNGTPNPPPLPPTWADNEVPAKLVPVFEVAEPVWLVEVEVFGFEGAADWGD